ncbi:MAG TPA: alpha/beta hydrolase [Terriglobia bacterium]|nr:alpha/beta hydrolase [Terriglobia bacterium]
MNSGVEAFVQFRSPARKILRGMIHRPPTVAGRRGVPGVIFLHGFTGDRMESHWMFVKCARALSRAGFASLRFDFYGSGESEGDFSEASFESEISDAFSAVEFLRRQRGVDSRRLALIGLSLGGAIAASIAHRAGAQALVLWAAVSRFCEVRTAAEQMIKPIPGSNGIAEYNGHAVSLKFLGDSEDPDPLRQIALFRKPTLIIHPGNDLYIPQSAPQDYFDAAGATVKEKVIVPGADHTFSSLDWEHQVIEQSVEWLRTHLVT